MYRTNLLLALLLSAANASPAQTRVTLNGFVRDSLSRETLIGASITVQGVGRGVNTNAYGFFSLSLPPGGHVLVVTYVGYAPREVSVVAGTDQRMDIALLPLGSLSQEIVVSSRRRDANVRNTQMGRVDLPMSRIRALPVIFGEVDPLKTLQLLPGVTTAGEGNSGIYVRGGGPDQNLIMLDDAVVYNTGHLFGTPSRTLP